MNGGREVALAVLTVLDAPPPEVVDVAAAAGFDAVTLRLLGGPRGEIGPLVGDTPTRRETCARLRHHGLGVLDVEVVRLDGETDITALRPVLESAAVLGARHVVALDTEPDEARATERFGELCEEASGFDLRVALEFMLFTECRTIRDADRIVEQAGHPAGAVLVDPLHLQRSGGSPADVAELAAAHPERYPYAQLCDAPAEAPAGGVRALYAEAVHRRLHPGDGELPLAAFVAALPAGAALSVELPVPALADRPPAERARRAMDSARRLLGG